MTQVAGSTRTQQCSSAAIFVLGTVSAQPEPQSISALLHFTGHRYPRGPLQQQIGKTEGMETGHDPPHFVLGVGQSRAAILTKWVQRCAKAKEKDPGSPASPIPEVSFPQTLYPGPREIRPAEE